MCFATLVFAHIQVSLHLSTRRGCLRGMMGMCACAARRGPKEHDPTPPPASGSKQDQLYATAFWFDDKTREAHSYRLMVNRPKRGRPQGVPKSDRSLEPAPPEMPTPDGRTDGFTLFASQEEFERHANAELYPRGSGMKLTAGNATKLWKLHTFFVDMRQRGIICGTGLIVIVHTLCDCMHALAHLLAGTYE
jgi:hypothetical protein